MVSNFNVSFVFIVTAVNNNSETNGNMMWFYQSVMDSIENNMSIDTGRELNAKNGLRFKPNWEWELISIFFDWISFRLVMVMLFMDVSYFCIFAVEKRKVGERKFQEGRRQPTIQKTYWARSKREKTREEKTKNMWKKSKHRGINSLTLLY